MSKEKNSVKIDAKVKPSTVVKILARATKEKRNKSEMIRTILEESFETTAIDPEFGDLSKMSNYFAKSKMDRK